MFRNLLTKSLVNTSQKFTYKNVSSYVNMNALFNQHKRFFSTSDGLTILINAVNKKDLATIASLAIEQPRLIAQQTYNDNSALHEAARLGDVDMIKVLQKSFDAHFDVNHRCHCSLQRTPILYAVENNHYAAAELLFKLGADANIADERNRTALDYACKAYEKGNKDFANMIELISANKGKANNHKAEPILLEIKKTKRAQQFNAEYAIQESHLHQEMQEAKQNYLHTVINRLTPGKK